MLVVKLCKGAVFEKQVDCEKILMTNTHGKSFCNASVKFILKLINNVPSPKIMGTFCWSVHLKAIGLNPNVCQIHILVLKYIHVAEPGA